MSRALFALALLAVLAGPAAAAPASGPSPSARATAHPHEGEEDLMPIQMYYHKNFFGEPWRQPDKYRTVVRQAAYVLAAAAVALLLSRARRGRGRA